MLLLRRAVRRPRAAGDRVRTEAAAARRAAHGGPDGCAAAGRVRHLPRAAGQLGRYGTRLDLADGPRARAGRARHRPALRRRRVLRRRPAAAAAPLPGRGVRRHGAGRPALGAALTDRWLSADLPAGDRRRVAHPVPAADAAADGGAGARRGPGADSVPPYPQPPPAPRPARAPAGGAMRLPRRVPQHAGRPARQPRGRARWAWASAACCRCSAPAVRSSVRAPAPPPRALTPRRLGGSVAAGRSSLSSPTGWPRTSPTTRPGPAGTPSRRRWFRG
ncbi:hypothetical protein SRIMM317S_00590 [Streptomyces rimosus subsp. rimosus]